MYYALASARSSSGSGYYFYSGSLECVISELLDHCCLCFEEELGSFSLSNKEKAISLLKEYESDSDLKDFKNLVLKEEYEIEDITSFCFQFSEYEISMIIVTEDEDEFKRTCADECIEALDSFFEEEDEEINYEAHDASDFGEALEAFSSWYS